MNEQCPKHPGPMSEVCGEAHCAQCWWEEFDSGPFRPGPTNRFDLVFNDTRHSFVPKSVPGGSFGPWPPVMGSRNEDR